MWDELQAALAEEPSELAFRAICSLLAAEPDDASAALALATDRLTAWPDSYRVAPGPWRCALHAGERTHSWSLVRTVRNFSPSDGGRVPLREMVDLARLAPVTRLELTGVNDDDLHHLLDTEEQWPRLDAVRLTWKGCSTGALRRLAASPLCGRLWVLALDGEPGAGDLPLPALRSRRLQHFALHSSWEQAADLLERSELPRLRTLKLTCVGSTAVDPGAAARLGRVFGRAGVKGIDVRFGDPAEIAALLPLLSSCRLREISLHGPPLLSGTGAGGGAFVRALWGQGFLGTLRRLTIANYPLNAEDMHGLAAALRQTRIERLELSNVGMNDEGAFALASCTGPVNLVALNLQGNCLSALGAAAIAGSPSLRRLEELNLGGDPLTSTEGGVGPQPVGDEGLIVLAGSPGLDNLRVLRLGRTALTPRGIAALAATRRLRSLTTVDLSGNDLGVVGARLLARASWWPSLRHLDLSACKLDGSAVVELTRAPGPSRLRSLRLAHNSLDEKAVRALAECLKLATLWALDLQGSLSLEETSQVVATARVLRQLVELNGEPTLPTKGAVRLSPG